MQTPSLQTYLDPPTTLNYCGYFNLIGGSRRVLAGARQPDIAGASLGKKDPYHSSQARNILELSASSDISIFQALNLYQSMARSGRCGV